MSTEHGLFRSVLVASAVAVAGSAAQAQSPPKQVVKPPVAQAWIDVATFSGFAMGGAMGAGGPGGGGMMNQTLGALMGGGKGNAKAEFGFTQTGTTGRWMDVTLYTSRNPSLAEALQGVPEGTGLAPTLKLQTPEKPKPTPQSDEEPAPLEYEPPKGKFLLYWGCSETVRPAQPRVLDLETATLAEFGKFMESRRATQRGTHAAVGRPIWPSKDDKRALPTGATLVGQHTFTGQGVPESFRFGIAAAQDIMPEIKLRQTDKGNSVLLEWDALPTARAYFLGSMGAREGETTTMVIWTSSELPDSGFGLFDYQTNTAVDKWLREQVLLPPTTTRCSVPKEAAAQGMLRAIAYGTEVNMAYPPRPSDPKIPWEPDWNVKIRVKSMTSTMFGMPEMSGMGSAGGTEEMSDAPEPGTEAAPAAEPKKKKKFNPFDVVKDVVKDQLP